MIHNVDWLPAFSARCVSGASLCGGVLLSRSENPADGALIVCLGAGSLLPSFFDSPGLSRSGGHARVLGR
jgi:hypothetical protein